MKLLRIALAWLALCGAAYGQAQVPAGGVMGNSTAALRPARAETVTAIFDRALGSTRGSIIERGAGGWALIGPGTAGLPFVSAGAGADPLYQLLGATGGGTGQGVYVIGDILYASTTTALSRLADIATGNALLSGGVGAAPAWGKVTSAHITGQALTKTDDTNVTATLGGTPTTALVNAASITLGWTGQLAITRGGTGAATAQAAINAMHPTPSGAGTLAYYNGTNWVALAGNATGTRVLQEDSSGVPSWVAAGSGTVTSAIIAPGNGISVSGTCTITTTGTCTVAQSLTNATLNGQPGNPTGTTSGTGVMMGLGVTTCRITPVYSSRVFAVIDGSVLNSTVGALASFNVRFGTGAGPANGAAASGTAVTASTSTGNGGAVYQSGFSKSAVITGLTPGVAIWLDVSLASSGGTSTVAGIGCMAYEF